jgi:2,4-dienoyl-CoA reductase (NADPH2)
LISHGRLALPPVTLVWLQVVSYVDVLTNRVKVGPRVALVGAGGIGHDVAAFLLHDPAVDSCASEPTAAQAAAFDSAETEKFMSYWGIDGTLQSPGGLVPRNIPPPRRQIFLLQRKSDKVGGGLGKTTGWIHRAVLKVMIIYCVLRPRARRFNCADCFFAFCLYRAIL